MIFLQFLWYIGWIFHSPHTTFYECGPNHQCVTGLFMKTLRNPKSHFCQCCRLECWPPEHLTYKSCHFSFVPLDMKDQIQIQNQIQNQILMSDEDVDGEGRVWKRINERLADPCISETDRYGVHLSWCSAGFLDCTVLILLWSRGSNLNGVRYRDEILQQVEPFMQNHPEVEMFQHDNTRPHTARVAQHSSLMLGLSWWTGLQSPLTSTQLKTCGHCSVIRSRSETTPKEPGRTDCCSSGGVAIHPTENIMTLISSMSRRCLTCVKSRDEHIGY